MSSFEGYYSGASCGGDYEVRLNMEADEAEDGRHVAWEVWHVDKGPRPLIRSTHVETVMSDWFTATDAYRECLRLTSAARDLSEGGER